MKKSHLGFKISLLITMIVVVVIVVTTNITTEIAELFDTGDMDGLDIDFLGSRGDYIQLTMNGPIAISVNPDKITSGGATGSTGCTASGEYSIALYFPIEGGEMVEQNNTITLKNYNCATQGSSKIYCSAEVENPNIKQSFELTGANLALLEEIPEGYQISNSQVPDSEIFDWENTPEEKTQTFPATLTLDSAKTMSWVPNQVTISCTGASDYFMQSDWALNQMYLAFEGTVLPVTINGVDSQTTSQAVGSNGSFLADVTWVIAANIAEHTLMTITPEQ